jgi:phage gpG-like protein
MQPLRLDINVLGEDALNRTILRRSDHVKDFRPAFRKIRDRLRQVARRQFATEGSYGSGGWPDLAESTLARKRAAGQPARILVATGALRDSLTGAGAGSIDLMTTHEMRFGSSVSYGKFHAKGTRKMPRRSPINMPEAERRAILTELVRHIAGTPR